MRDSITTLYWSLTIVLSGIVLLGGLFSNKTFADEGLEFSVLQSVTCDDTSTCIAIASNFFGGDFSANGHTATTQEINCFENTECAENTSHELSTEGPDNTVTQDSSQTDNCTNFSACSSDSTITTHVIGRGNTATGQGTQMDECTNADCSNSLSIVQSITGNDNEVGSSINQANQCEGGSCSNSGQNSVLISGN